MKRLLILFQMGSEVRQFGHSGFIDEMLAHGWEVLVATRFSEHGFLSQLNPRVLIVSLPKPQPDFWYEQLAVLLDQAQSLRRKKTGGSTWSYGKSAPRNFRHRIRLWLQNGLSRVLSISAFLFRAAQRGEKTYVRTRGQREYGDFLKSYRPDAIIVSVPRLNYQSHLLSAAEKLGIPRFLFFHTNKDIIALSRLDHNFTAIGVWNQWMKENLLAQNTQVNEQTVHITGCAHFDCVGREDWLSPENLFRERLGVGETEEVVLYTAAGPGVLPEEERFIEVVIESLRCLPEISTRLVVRLNPMDDSPRLENYLRTCHPEIIVLRPDWHYVRSQNLCYQKTDDVRMWNDLLHYSAVCVNIPSTVTVECALTGLPVINLGFDLPGPKPLPGSVRAFWDVDYYANVRAANAALLIDTPSNLHEALSKCLENRNLFREPQKLLIRMELMDVRPPLSHQHYFELIEKFVA